MKAASLILSIMGIILSPFVGIFYLYTYKDQLTSGLSAEERMEIMPGINMVFKFGVYAIIFSTIISIVILIVSRILIAKKRKIPAGILTVIFVSKIGGLLTFFIKYDDDIKPTTDEEQSILGPVEEEETNEVRARNKCPFCGKVVSKFDEFCPHCGHKLF